MNPPPVSKDTNLATWVQYWIDCYATLRCKSGFTLDRYRSLAKYLVSGASTELRDVSQVSLANLTHQQVESALLDLLRQPASRKKYLSVRSVRHLGDLLRVALSRAERLGLIASNPMLKVELPPFERSEARSLSIEEVARLLEACRRDWTYNFVSLALAAGLRRGELLALEYEDLNYCTRTLSVAKSLEETRTSLKLKKTKNGRSRVLKLGESTLKLFPRYDLGGQLNQGLIFPDENGQWRRPACVSQVIARRLRKAGILKASLHTLRHTHGSLMLSNGMPLPAVSARLGHSDPGFTLRVYAHALPPDDSRVAEAWDRLVSTLRTVTGCAMTTFVVNSAQYT